ncbi:MAG: UDP-glucose 4-epimerase GalE [Rhizobiales bacterium]|nr:UDP-glucose 4-epimerase GalE [Hyphomicrobiales bacterium]NRB14725.1 UDP-glucose 4-epimerase GalE [Hyphomicrobiales bacterium]
MTVLVTGGAGYIGSHMVLNLIDAGEKVVVIDNLTTGKDWAIADGAEFVLGDVADISLVEATLKKYAVNAVIHFAGSIIVPESVENPLLYYSNNTAKTRNLLEAVVNCGVKHFIFSSTAAVYGDVLVDRVFETTPKDPVSPYGRSKLMTEWMLQDTAFAHDFNFVALRYFNVAGADPKGRTGQSTPNATHLIKVANQVALGDRDYMEVYGTDYDTRDGTCIRDYIHVSDLTKAHYLALGYLRAGGQSDIMNCGYGEGFTVREVLAAVKKVSGVEFEVRDVPRRAGDPPVVVANAELAKNKLNWHADYNDLELIVQNAFDWEKYLKTRNR